MKNKLLWIIYKLPIFFLIMAIYILNADSRVMEDLRSTNANVKVSRDTGVKRIALTFDDGPIPETTNQLLEELKARQMNATFFVQGKQAAKNPDIIRQMDKDGNEIGNHTYHHVDLVKLSNVQILEECNKTDRIIEYIIGKKTKVFRPTFGAYNKRVTQQIAENDKYVVLWSVDTRDWRRTDVNGMVNDVVSKVKAGDIILFHDVYATSVQAAIQVVDQLQAKGFEFVTVSQLIEGSQKKVEKAKVIKSIR